jgi:hypothetical protein
MVTWSLTQDGGACKRDGRRAVVNVTTDKETETGMTDKDAGTPEGAELRLREAWPARSIKLCDDK